MCCRGDIMMSDGRRDMCVRVCIATYSVYADGGLAALDAHGSAAVMGVCVCVWVCVDLYNN